MDTATATPSLAAYRTEHRIQVDDSGPLPTCAIDGIRIHPTRVGGWFHDGATITRLHREDVRAMVDAAYPTSEQVRVERAIERITSEFDRYMGTDDEDEPEFDRNPEGDPTLNGAFR